MRTVVIRIAVFRVTIAILVLMLAVGSQVGGVDVSYAQRPEGEFIAYYYSNRHLNGHPKTRKEYAPIDWNWGLGPKPPPTPADDGDLTRDIDIASEHARPYKGIPSDNFSAH